MKNNQKVIIVSIGLIALGLYYFYKQGKQNSEIAKDTDTSSKADWDKVLKKGSKGIEVEILQRALKQLKVDGDFGALTELRLKRVTGFTETSLNHYNTLFPTKK
jgi:hypothetical protein